MEKNNHKLNISYFFLSLGVLVSLITTIVSFLNLVFEILDKKMPDVLNAVYQFGYNSYAFDSARSSLATLIIVFPIFLILVYFWKKNDNNLKEYDVILKRWMVYALIFLASVIVLVDLIILVRYFVAGEITLRFILKVLAVIFVAAVSLLYFGPEVFENKWKNLLQKTTLFSSIFVFVFFIIFSFVVIGSPKTQRSLRLDEKRISDLQNIQWQVISYWQQKEKLPDSLEILSNPLSGSYLPIDPEFQKGKKYEYNKKGDLVFELCADFSLPMPEGWQEYNYGRGDVMPMYEKDIAVSYPSDGGVNESWAHEIGRTCFERTIDKDMYPPYPKPL
jgi:hypothetical protein